MSGGGERGGVAFGGDANDDEGEVVDVLQAAHLCLICDQHTIRTRGCHDRRSRKLRFRRRESLATL